MKSYKRTTITSALPYANGPIHLGHLAGAGVVAMQSPVPHHLDRRRNPGFGDRLLLRETSREPFHHFPSARFSPQKASVVTAMNPAATQ